MLRHCEKNRSFGGWISSFIIGCHGYVSREAICPSVRQIQIAQRQAQR